MNTKSNQTIITALYCRLSVEDMREGESLSIENQKKMLQEYADSNGFANCKFYVDDGYSGTDLSRPAYRRMLADIEAGVIGTVIVKDQSRLGRDHLETDRLMEIFFPDYDVRFIAITDGVDSDKGINEMSTFRNYFNDFYARDTSKKIRAVLKAKGERGERVGTRIPFGYMKDPYQEGHLVPDPETSPIVKKIFEMNADGIGIRRICQELEKLQICNPSVYAYRKTGRGAGIVNLDTPYCWSQVSVRNMLSNQVYCGDTVNFKTYSKSNKLKKRIKNAPEDMLVFENTHDPLISRKLFDLVQKRFEGRKRQSKTGEMDKYAGYLYCAQCGARLYINRGLDKTRYMCGSYQRRNTACSAHYIQERVLDAIVLDQLRKMTAYARENADEFYAMAAQNGEAEAKKYYAAAEQKRSQISSRVAQLDTIIRTLYEDRVVGRITPERYDVLAAGYETEQARLKAELQTVSEELEKMDMREKYVHDFVEQAKAYIEMPTLTPEILRTFVREIKVYEKTKKYSRKEGNLIVIHYTFQLPQEMLFSTEKENVDNSENVAI